MSKCNSGKEKNISTSLQARSRLDCEIIFVPYKHDITTTFSFNGETLIVSFVTPDKPLSVSGITFSLYEQHTIIWLVEMLIWIERAVRVRSKARGTPSRWTSHI